MGDKVDAWEEQFVLRVEVPALAEALRGWLRSEEPAAHRMQLVFEGACFSSAFAALRRARRARGCWCWLQMCQCYCTAAAIAPKACRHYLHYN